MTLIEVMAALAILGVLLAFVLTARARYVHQYQAALLKNAAAAATDDLLKSWWLGSETVPVPASGALPEHPELTWTTKVTNDHLDGLGDVKVIAISVRRTATPEIDQPLLDIELLQPNPPPSKEKP